MIEWLRRMFAPRRPDPTLQRAQAIHAARTEKVPATVEHAHEVASQVVREVRQSHSDQMRDSFARADRRLSGR